MSSIQDASSGRAPRSVPAAQRPFTRFLRKILGQTLPSLYNKVDRLILTALVDLLEGEHRTDIALPVPQLARRAGVSPASATRALARLESASIITREKKKLTQAGRYIWVLGLTPAYQVTQAPSEAIHGAVCHVTKACQGEGAMHRPENMLLEDHHPDVSTVPVPPTRSDDEVCRSREEGGPGPGELEAAIHALELQWQAASPESEIETPEAPPEAVECLRSVGIDLWKARQLAQEHSLLLITQAVETLRYRAGTVRNPAAWIIRELERGGYAAPPAQAQATQRQAQQAAKAEQKEREDQLRAQAEQEQEQERARKLRGFEALAPERQLELLEQARSRLRQISPKMAEAPLDLERPGPMSALLFELLEGISPGSRLSGPTPREGGWDSRRCERSPAAACAAGP